MLTASVAAEEVAADRVEPVDVADVVGEGRDPRDDVGDARELGAQLGLAHRHHREVPVRLADRPQHARGAARDRRARDRPASTSASASGAGVVDARAPRPRRRRGRAASRAASC